MDLAAAGDESSIRNRGQGYVDDDDDGGERPPFVLIEPYAYLTNRINATTASTPILYDAELEGCSVQVTFIAVHPPDVSYLCVHAVGLGDLLADPPRILATETGGSLLLLRVPIPFDRHHLRSYACIPTTREEYFVYNPRVPALHHLRHPEPDSAPCLVEGTVAIVRKLCSQHRQQQPHGHGAGGHDSGNCSYVIAANSHRFGSEYPNCQLYRRYHSKTSSWTTPSLVFDPPIDDEHKTHKTIVIGGEKGTLAWVDLCAGTVILWDVLVKGRPKFRRLQLPGPVVDGSDHDGSTRDIAFLGSSINYVVMEDFAGGWKATVWSIKTDSIHREEGWGIRYQLDSSDLLQGHEGEPAATAPYIGLPKLSLQHDGIVYFLTRLDYSQKHHTAWVLAVDMSNKTVLKVGRFIPSETSGFYLDYDTSKISKYLNIAPGRKKIPKRPGTQLLKSPSKKHTVDTHDPMVIDTC